MNSIVLKRTKNQDIIFQELEQRNSNQEIIDKLMYILLNIYIIFTILNNNNNIYNYYNVTFNLI